MRSAYSMHGRLSQEQTIFCLNVISNSKGLLFLIYAPHQYFTHYGSAYVQLKGIQILTICLISKGLLFLYTLYRVYKKKRNLGISQEIDIVLKTKDFRRREFKIAQLSKLLHTRVHKAKFMHLLLNNNSNMIY